VGKTGNRILEEDLSYILEKFEERDRLAKANVLITGCAGFLGFSFMHFFQRYGGELGVNSVTALDSFLLGRPRWLEEMRDAPCLSIRRFDIAHGDMGDLPNLKHIDYVIHLASIASPTFYRKYPLETIDANVWGLRKLLDFFRERQVRGFLFFSSSEVYGDPPGDHIPTGEEYRGNVASTGPRACYDEAKRFGETLCWVFAQRFGLPITVVRPFNNYGPGMSLADGRVPADFARAVLENRDITIYSDGTPTRAYCYAADAVTGFLKALVHGRFDYFNIGIEGPEISVADLARIYERAGKSVLGYRGSIVYEKPPEKDYLTHNPSRRCPDISKARRVLGYAPEFSAEAGVERFIEFLKEGGENP
jgi:UDP-glucuronate decarboxylase